MDKKPKALQRILVLTMFLLTSLGLLFIVSSFVIDIGEVKDLVRGIGLSLFPAGIVALLLYFFSAKATEEQLQKNLKESVGQRIDIYMKEISTNVEDGIKEIDGDVKRLAPVFVSCAKRGIENVFLNRGAALDSFSWFLNAEVRKAQQGEDARLWFVCSSMKGFIGTAGEYMDGADMMEKIAKCGCDLRIIMTDPEVANLRAQQEGRADGEIPDEISGNLALLKRIGVSRETVRYYTGTPTVFAIATMDHMLLNPYPYEREAFRCFSLIVYKTLDSQADIYHQYLIHHFEKPWNRAREIRPDDWNRLK